LAQEHAHDRGDAHARRAHDEERLGAHAEEWPDEPEQAVREHRDLPSSAWLTIIVIATSRQCGPF
jgi:hypothetical protein